MRETVFITAMGEYDIHGLFLLKISGIALPFQTEREMEIMFFAVFTSLCQGVLN